MDQLAALNCTADNALFCDMRTLEIEQVPLPLAASGLTILVIDTHASTPACRRRIPTAPSRL